MSFSKLFINRIFFSLILIFAVVAGWAVSELLKNNDSSNNINLHFNLTDHFGSNVTESNYSSFNKVFFFGFTHCPDICPISVNLLSNVIDDLTSNQFPVKKFKFFFVTIDPNRDTPERLKEFLESFSNEIIGLTGSQRDLVPVWKDFFVHVKASVDSEHHNYLSQDIKNHESRSDSENYMVQHTAFFYVFDKNNNLHSILPFGSTIEQVTDELKRLL